MFLVQNSQEWRRQKGVFCLFPLDRAWLAVQANGLLAVAPRLVYRYNISINLFIWPTPRKRMAIYLKMSNCSFNEENVNLVWTFYFSRTQSTFSFFLEKDYINWNQFKLIVLLNNRSKQLGWTFVRHWSTQTSLCGLMSVCNFLCNCSRAFRREAEV